MSSEPPKQQQQQLQQREWLCIMPDQEGARARRLEARPRHFEGVDGLVEQGFLTWGGAALEEVPPDSNPQNFKFWGSVMTAVGATREEVIEKLKNDPYSQGAVWDWDRVQIMPFLCAVRQPLKK